MTEKYHFNVPGPIVWIFHIIIGLFLTYFGYAALQHKLFPDYVYIIIIILGVFGILYHTHIWLFDNDDESKSSSL